MSWLKAVVVVLVSILVSAGVAWAAAGDVTATFAGIPVIFACAALAFVINWIAFVPAWLKKTERFYDLTGAITYLSVVSLALATSGAPSLPAVLIAGAVAIWSIRLGSFLFRRVHRDGKDGRFDEIKRSAPRFFIAWTLQALWVFLTSVAALTAITSLHGRSPGALHFLGLAIWLLGFAIEAIADAQKSRFRSNPAHRGRFITGGLWAWSRHPNYFGEIVLWVGLAVASIPSLSGTQWVVWVSPAFVVLLLTRISGIPLLEERADARWGEEPAYQAYKAQTSQLVPLPPRRQPRAALS